MPKNPTVKTFLILPSSHPYKLLFNKYEISKIMGQSHMDFESLTSYVLELSEKSDQLLEGKECFSIKTLQKIAVTTKRINSSQCYSMNEIYEVLVMGFRLLGEKFKVYNKNGLKAYFINFIKTYEALYPKGEKLNKTGYNNVLSFIYHHFKAISEYTLESVKS